MEQKLGSQIEGEGFGRKIELGLVFMGAFVNTVIAVIFGAQQAAFPGTPWQNLFPFPLLYLIEIIALSFLAILTVVHTETKDDTSNWTPTLIWIAAGGLLAFVILGGFSIGFYLIPGMLAFIVAGLLADRRQNLSTVGHVGILFLTASVQAAIMLILVNWF